MSAAERPPLVDTHVHLQDSVYDDDRSEVLARAAGAGVLAMVCVGYDLESSRRAVDLADRHAPVYAAVGIHPNSAAEATDADWREIRKLARRPKVVGVGETGLDNYRKYTSPAVQEEWFRRHLRLADETGLPVIVHNRQADQRVRELLREWVGERAAGRPPGVMHCFSSDLAMLETCLALGFVISIAGPVTFKNAEPLRSVARSAPVGRLVVETDCPYLAPHPLRGTRNEPAYVELTTRRLAEERDEPFDALARRTTATAADLFTLRISAELGAEAS